MQCPPPQFVIRSPSPSLEARGRFDLSRAKADLDDRIFRASEQERIGFEVEFLPLAAGHGTPVPMIEVRDPLPGVHADAARFQEVTVPGLLPLLREHADRSGWLESTSPYGAPRFATPRGGTLSFEPGGQLEWSSPPVESVDEVLAAANATLPDLASRCLARGVRLVSRGIDPFNEVEASHLGLRNQRYVRMDRYLREWAPYGMRMMRQTAAVHVNLDWGEEPERRWRAATVLVPYLTAIFANSARYGGRETGHRSYRAHQWRNLDPARTGVLPAEEPRRALLQRALDAPDFLSGESGYEPFGVRMAERRVTEAQWSAHLSTLFHEVRPREYLEFRSIDSLPPRWFAAPMVFLVGLLYDRKATERVLGLAGGSPAARLEAAGRLGLADPAFAEPAKALFREALEGASRLGSRRVGDAALSRAEAFYLEFTERGRDPAWAACPSERPILDHTPVSVPLDHGS